MPNDERILNVLQQTLTEIQRMNTRLAKIETSRDFGSLLARARIGDRK